MKSSATHYNPEYTLVHPDGAVWPRSKDVKSLMDIMNRLHHIEDRNAPGVIWDLCFMIKESYDIGFKSCIEQQNRLRKGGIKKRKD